MAVDVTRLETRENARMSAGIDTRVAVRTTVIALACLGYLMAVRWGFGKRVFA